MDTDYDEAPTNEIIKYSNKPWVYTGIDCDTKRISFGALDEYSELAAVAWFDWSECGSYDYFIMADLDLFLDDEFVSNMKGIVSVELISNFSSGSHNSKTAGDINFIGSTLTGMLVAKDCYVTNTLPRTWMSRVIGLQNRKNPSKDKIKEWCHDRWDFDELSPRWTHEITRGPRKGQVDEGINDCYDALVIAEFARGIY